MGIVNDQHKQVAKMSIDNNSTNKADQTIADIEQMAEAGVYFVVKYAYDCCDNPYFDKDGRLISIPEAIDYLLQVAKNEASNDKGNPNFGTIFGEKWIKKIKNINPEEDPNFEPAKTNRFGLSPAQVYFMKCAHEYYLAHVGMQPARKTFKALKASHYDMKLIVDLQNMKKTDILRSGLSFPEIRSFAIHSVVEEILSKPDF